MSPVHYGRDDPITSLSAVEGQMVGHSYNSGFIVLSCVISIIGCWTALELLHRRTSSRGAYNWSLLIGAATSMGAVAIWSMHFIGNQAIVMGNGDDALQIVYSAGFTAGSFFLAIGVVAFAFFLFSITDTVNVIRTVLGGLVTGAAICGMHYMGQAGIANYNNMFDVRFIIGSAIVAVVAATSALGLFFYLRSAWTNALWKRFSCAVLLGCAVSGMHWTATFGNSYQASVGIGTTQGSLSRAMTVAIVSCLSMGCCVLLIGFAVLGQRSRKLYADRAQQLVLGCAIWDPDGKLLVTPQGLLPCRKISNSYLERSFDDVFSVEHPVFGWIFRASRCWKGVADLVPAMRNHLRADSFMGKSSPNISGPSSTNTPDGSEDYSQIFEELFCIAASDLASVLQEPLEKLGMLYDEIISTGTLKRGRVGFFTHRPTMPGASDLERGQTIMFGRGQLLFVVRHCDRLEAAHFQSVGFRFAPVSHVVDQLARSMQVTAQELLPRLDGMQRYPTQPEMLAPGVHVVFFALRPLYQRGFDILTRKNAKNLLPSLPLPVARLERWHTDLISNFDNWRVGDLIKHWNRLSANQFTNDDQKTFFGQMCTALKQLGEQISEELFRDARLTARPLRSPCNPERHPDGTPAQAMLIAFRLITDVHQSQLANDAVFTSSKFFLTQQHVYPNSPDHEIFSRRIHREFAGVLEKSIRDQQEAREAKARHRLLRGMPSSPGLGGWRDLHNCSKQPGEREYNSSEKNLVEPPLGSSFGATGGSFGGIHVSSEVTVDVQDIDNGGRTPDVEMMKLGAHSEISVAPVERESFVDELMALTIGERRQQRP